MEAYLQKNQSQKRSVINVNTYIYEKSVHSSCGKHLHIEMQSYTEDFFAEVRTQWQKYNFRQRFLIYEK